MSIADPIPMAGIDNLEGDDDEIVDDLAWPNGYFANFLYSSGRVQTSSNLPPEEAINVGRTLAVFAARTADVEGIAPQIVDLPADELADLAAVVYREANRVGVERCWTIVSTDDIAATVNEPQSEIDDSIDRLTEVGLLVPLPHQLVIMLDQEHVPKPGRNDPCPCGSERKSKRCCWEPTR